MKRIKRYESFTHSPADMVKESVDMAKKVFRDAGMDWVAVTRTPPDQWHNLKLPERRFLEVRDELRKSNNLGFLGLFAKLLAEKNPTRDSAILRIHHLLMDVKPVLSNLRDSNGEKVSIFDLNTAEQIEDSLTRLGEWRKVNQFMRQLPPTQKDLVWPDGYWAPALRGSAAFLNKAVTELADDEDRSRRLLSKISAIRTPGQFLQDVERLSQKQVHEYDQLLDRLNSSRNVIVTWQSRQRNAIIAMVLTHRALKKVAPTTAWCIRRDKSYFDSYTRDGLQFVLYDLDQPQTSNMSIIGFTLGNQSENPLRITACHDRADYTTRLPDEFTNVSEYRDPLYEPDDFVRIGRGVHEVKPEYVQVPEIDYSRILLEPAQFKLIALKITKLKNAALASLSRFLKKPVVSRFLDFWA